MEFGLQHPNYSFDYRNHDTSQIIVSLSNLVTRAEMLGFDSFWVMDHFHQIPIVGKPEEPMLESWTTISVLAGVTSKIKLGTVNLDPSKGLDALNNFAEIIKKS